MKVDSINFFYVGLVVLVASYIATKFYFNRDRYILDANDEETWSALHSSPIALLKVARTNPNICNASISAIDSEFWSDIIKTTGVLVINQDTDITSRSLFGQKESINAILCGHNVSDVDYIRKLMKLGNKMP